MNQRVNYPIKRVLITQQIKEFFNFDDPVMKFCASWVTMYICQDALQQLVNSWNYHRVPGPNGCIPVENMCHSNRAVRIPEELQPTTEEIVRRYEERGGSLTHDGNFGGRPSCFEGIATRSRLMQDGNSSCARVKCQAIPGSLQSRVIFSIRHKQDVNKKRTIYTSISRLTSAADYSFSYKRP